MKKYIITIVKFGLIFLLIAVGIGKLYNTGIHRPPLKYANISDQSKQYIDKVVKNNKDLGLSYVEQGPFDWNNTEDYAYEKDGWAYEEDKDFIVYYKRDRNAIWQTNAQEVLMQARENVGLLEDLFGKYYYASDMNGRKLAIYLPDSPSLYKQTVCDLMETTNYDTKDVAGITITQIGILGCKTKGIVLSPECFEYEPEEPNGYIPVLKHEMNHYVFFSSLDYEKNVKHYLWVSEGIAEYFSNPTVNYLNTDEVKFIEEKCYLNAEFPRERHSAYWAGESFFRFLEANKGVQMVSKFLNDSYTLPTDSVFAKNALDIEQLHIDWVSNIQENAQPVIEPLDEISLQ